MSAYRKAALEDQPEGEYCHWCGEENHFCDDIGWFCIWPFANAGELCGITCEGCYRGPSGELHISRYGMGDR